MSALVFSERPAADRPAGLLVLHHGRGVDEHDLLPLGDALDPTRRLHVVAPRAPLRLPGSTGNHWYLVPQVGHPDPETFRATCQTLAELHDELWERTGIDPRMTILAGFSMGAVMSYALGLGSGRPAPGGILAFSGFLPIVAGWQLDLAGRQGLRVLIAHGRRDPIIAVAFGHEARSRLEAGGLEVDYRESDVAHQIDPATVPVAAEWLDALLCPA